MYLLLSINFVICFSFQSLYSAKYYCPGNIMSGTVTRRDSLNCAAWSCGLIFQSLLTIQVTSLFQQHYRVYLLLGRLQGDREPVSLLLILLLLFKVMIKSIIIQRSHYVMLSSLLNLNFYFFLFIFFKVCKKYYFQQHYVCICHTLLTSIFFQSL